MHAGRRWCVFGPIGGNSDGRRKKKERKERESNQESKTARCSFCFLPFFSFYDDDDDDDADDDGDAVKKKKNFLELVPTAAGEGAAGLALRLSPEYAHSTGASIENIAAYKSSYSTLVE